MDPRPLDAVSRLKDANFMISLQGKGDFVEPPKQPGATARIDLETVPFSRGRCNRLCLEIDTDMPGSLGVLDLRGKAIDNFLVDYDREDAVLKAVGEENIAEA